jgi:protein-S-isoprenylcysteine O-methyltransferase Ste14
MKLSRLRKITVKLLFVYALVIVVIFAADPKPDKWRTTHFWVGIGLLLASLWIRVWAAGHLVKNKVLTVTGPYAYVKNPLYIGTFLGMVGFAFLTIGPRHSSWYHHYFNWIILGLGLLVFVAYYIPYKKKREGDRLHDLFGEAWDHYDQAVPDYFPKLLRYERAQERPWSWSATCENSEQWTPFAMSIGVAAVIWNGWIIEHLHRLTH